MPLYTCKKGAWSKPVMADNEQGAAAVFKCDECSLFPKQCDGYSLKIRKDLSAEDRARLALHDLAKNPPKNRRVKVEALIEGYRKEILAARKIGHSWKQIAETMKKSGLNVSSHSLYRYLGKQV